MSDHAYLSASQSERWINCPPSAALCAKAEDRPTEYSQQGTDAHTLAAYLVEKALGRGCRDPTEDLTWYNAEIQEAAEGYRDFVMEQVESLELPLVCVEQRLDFSKWVEHGFGTGDCVIVSDNILHIIDFKYGVGVLVEAKDNSQLKCYALGAVETFGSLYGFNCVRLSICQPRRGNVDTWELSKEDLMKWANDVLAPAAKLAYEGKGEFKAGPHCRFCKVKAACRKRAEDCMKPAEYDFIKPPLLSDDEIAEVLQRIDGLVSWAEDVKTYALQNALSGVKYPGWKLVEGRSSCRYTDEEAAARAVSEAGYDPYEKKLLGVTEMQKQLGRKKFDELLSKFIIKPKGKPTLVPDTDERPEFSTAQSDFTEENNNE